MNFIGTQESDQWEEGVHLLGIAFDGTTTFRPGARFGPDHCRMASDGLETFSPYLKKDLEDFPLFDHGNLPFSPSFVRDQYKNFDALLGNNEPTLLTLGGEHSISYAPIKHYLKRFPELCLLHLDAHADLRREYLGEKYSHACIIRRALDHFGPKHQLIQYGIRSGTREEYQWMEDNKTLRINLDSLLTELQDTPHPIYLTLDLDFFDPSFLPGTGTPEAGGENFESFIKIVKVLQKKNFVGADVTELAPLLDTSGNSSCFAAKVVRELLLALC